MKTELYPIHPDKLEAPALNRAARVLAEGGLVAFPTETVYGLGANADRPDALQRLREVKGRPEGKPFTHHLADVDDLFRLIPGPPEAALRLARKFWPGPLTIVFPRGREGLGVRVPAHPVARELIRRSGVPLVAPSANPSGQPPAVTARDVLGYFDGRIEVVLDGGSTSLQAASSVIRFTSDTSWELLREGTISREMIARAVCGTL
ncbi:MAG: threonylcarbamoyl-AMP synthase [Planctomycetes bacterium]|nr:threonylcarbamoyl-AMP synthase [Planctomycetota bacterium]